MSLRDALDQALNQAAELTFEIRHLAAGQCLNCGLAYHNNRRSHDPRGPWGLFGPRCRYNPRGWAAASKIAGARTGRPGDTGEAGP